MKLTEIAKILDATVLCGQALDTIDIDSAFGSDMMSDVLAFDVKKTVLLTGLVNLHVIRTAELLDVRCILFVRGKTIPSDIIELADEAGIVVLYTDKTLYTACGELYMAGLPGCRRT